jgi:DNA repair exonuclease SbcCD ATPase subunit
MALEETEINVGGVKFKGVYIAVVLGFVSTIAGTIWTASELYSRLEAVEAYEIPDTTPLHEDIELIKQELEDNDVKSLQGKLAELGTNLKTIIEQQKELLLIKERVVQAEKDVEAMRATVQEARLIADKVEGFETYLKQFDSKFERVNKEIDDIWLGMDELSNPLGGG